MNTILQKRIEEAAVAIAPFNRMSQKRDYFVKGCEWMLNNLWISVEEALPPYEEDVIVYFIHSDYNLNGNMFCHRTRRDDVSTDKNGFCIYNNEIITHWMPIPQIGGEK